MRGHLTALVGGGIGAAVLGAGVGLTLVQIPWGDGMDGLAWVATAFLAAAVAAIVGAGVGTAFALRRLDGSHSTTIGVVTSVLLLISAVPVVFITDLGARWVLGPFALAPVAARWLVLSRRPRPRGDGGWDGSDAAGPCERQAPASPGPGRTPPSRP